MTDGELFRRIWSVTDRVCEDNDIRKILEAAKTDILDPVTDPTMNTGVPFLTMNSAMTTGAPQIKEGDGIMIIDTRDAELKLALLVRKIFKYFGEVAPRRAL